MHPLHRLSDHLGGARIWAKREDVASGLAYGGNTTRKLEHLIPDPIAAGADTLVSIGGYQSNHTRQVAAVAAHLGMRAVLVQEKWVDWPDPSADRVGNIMLSRIMGAEVRLDPAGFGIGFKASRPPDLRERDQHCLGMRVSAATAAERSPAHAAVGGIHERRSRQGCSSAWQRRSRGARDPHRVRGNAGRRGICR